MNNENTLYPLILSLLIHLFVVYFFFFGSPFIIKSLPSDDQVISVEIVPIAEKVNIKNRASNTKREDQQKTNQLTKKIESTRPKEESKIQEQTLTGTKKNNTLGDNKVDVNEPKISDSKHVSESVNNVDISKKNIVKNQVDHSDDILNKIENSLVNDKSSDNATKIATVKPDDIKNKQNQIKVDNKYLSKISSPKVENKAKLKELDDLLKSLEQSSDGVKDAKTNKRTKAKENFDKKSSSSNIFDEHNEESINYSTLIGQQLRENWNKPAGIIDKQFAIKFNIRYSQDGSLIDYKLIDKNCFELDQMTCTALIDSVQRAIAAVNPIKHVNSNRYNEWSEINYNFVPDDN